MADLRQQDSRPSPRASVPNSKRASYDGQPPLRQSLDGAPLQPPALRRSDSQLSRQSAGRGAGANETIWRPQPEAIQEGREEGSIVDVGRRRGDTRDERGRERDVRHTKADSRRDRSVDSSRRGGIGSDDSRSRSRSSTPSRRGGGGGGRSDGRRRRSSSRSSNGSRGHASAQSGGSRDSYDSRRGRGVSGRRRHHGRDDSDRSSFRGGDSVYSDDGFEEEDDYSSRSVVTDSTRSRMGGDSSSRTWTGTASGTLTGTTGSGTVSGTMSGSYFTEDDTFSRDGGGAGGAAMYKGDVSKWGRRQDPTIYSDVSDTTHTLSSGLSPRDTHPREAPFDIRAAKKTLAYNAAQFGRAQAMRRGGLSPHHVGISEDLPDRMAYEQLNQLAGMANKVQIAIEHNKAVFERRLRSEAHNLKKQAFGGWRALKMGTLAQQQVLRRAIAKMTRSKLFNAFNKWRSLFHLVDKNFAMRRKLTATIQRGLMKRCFAAWRAQCLERHAERLVDLREQNIRFLERMIAGFRKRPIVVLKKRRLFAVMEAWKAQAAWRKEKRERTQLRMRKAAGHMLKSQYNKAWNSWREFTMVMARRRDILKKAALRMRNIAVAAAFNKWWELVEHKRRRAGQLNRVMRHWKNKTLSKGWEAWRSFVEWRKEKKKIMMRWMNPMKAKAFYSWLDTVATRKRQRLILTRVMLKMKNAKLAAAWYTWCGWLEDLKAGRLLETKEQLAVRVEELGAENERLRRDNERFVRLIDSGEWGRGRVAELVAAGEILKGERDALLKLIQSLRKEYENVQNAKTSQEDEHRSLKERMVLGGAARNRMLVKGGSSFNALVRAMKQDLLDGGPAGAAPAARDPNLLYAVDKLSMDHVTVFPDGELNVRALANAPIASNFARPVSTGRGPDRRAPVQPYNVGQQLGRTPQGLALLRDLDGGGGRIGGAHAPYRPGVPPGGWQGGLAGRSGGGGAGPDAAATQRVVMALQSLTPAEVDRVEAAVRSEMSRAGGGVARPAGLSSTYQ